MARRAGVSLATASRVLNGSSRTVGARLAERVHAAADELSYSPHGPAQAMARGHTMSIGMLAPDIADPYFTQLSAGATEAAGLRSMMLSVAVHHADAARELQQVRSFRAQRVRGLMIAGSRPAGEDPGPLLRALGELPAVVVGPPVGDLPVIGFANREGAADLARALLQVGYQRFVILAGPVEHTTSVERTEGFTAVLDDAAAPYVVQRAAFSRDGGHQAMVDALAAARGGATCVFAVTDMMALGAMTALHEHGVEAGRDVGVAGFNDLPVLADLRPGLSTVRLPLREAGQAAIEALLGGDLPAEPFRGEVVLRASTPGC
ncbi:LacI family DNA-binding transcriptional regulator [Aestuariimicrobium sp. Y1814]|uniref:LacI family DNA-binding transcriptional regulator n=1 Tax=Aestuariimicrobium sp. Y1814 TaxID=3418742 RepID=UPI003DA72DF6